MWKEIVPLSAALRISILPMAVCRCEGTWIVLFILSSSDALLKQIEWKWLPRMHACGYSPDRLLTLS